jgi:hypothetical protein
VGIVFFIIGLLFLSQQGIHLDNGIKDTDETDEDDQTGRKKSHNEVQRILQGIGSDKRLHAKDEKDDGQNGYRRKLEPPQIIIHKEIDES